MHCFSTHCEHSCLFEDIHFRISEINFLNLSSQHADDSTLKTYFVRRTITVSRLNTILYPNKHSDTHVKDSSVQVLHGPQPAAVQLTQLQNRLHFEPD